MSPVYLVYLCGYVFVGCMVYSFTADYYTSKLQEFQTAQTQAVQKYQQEIIEARKKANEEAVENQRVVSDLNSQLTRLREQTNRLRASAKPTDRQRAQYCDLGTECAELLIQALEAVRFCRTNHK